MVGGKGQAENEARGLAGLAGEEHVATLLAGQRPRRWQSQASAATGGTPTVERVEEVFALGCRQLGTGVFDHHFRQPWLCLEADARPAVRRGRLDGVAEQAR